MKELSLNILDVTQNSITAGATLIQIHLTEDEEGMLSISIKDNGCGMSDEVVKRVIDPFYTTRTTRKVGLGIPLLKLAAEQTGGALTITSVVDDGKTENHGTEIKATFDTKNIDFTPIGDIVSTICILIQSADNIDFEYVHSTPKGTVELYTSQMRQVLGDVPLSSFEVIEWAREYLNEQYSTII